MVVFDTSNNESIIERLPEFLLPKGIGLHYLILWVGCFRICSMILKRSETHSTSKDPNYNSKINKHKLFSTLNTVYQLANHIIKSIH